MFPEDKWAECGLTEKPSFGSNSFEKAAQDFDGFGEPILKNTAGVPWGKPVRGTGENNESATLNVGARVRHLTTGKLGTVRTLGRSIEVGFYDGTIYFCDPDELECAGEPVSIPVPR